MTGWTISYILDEITLQQLMLIYTLGIEFESMKAIIFLNKYGEALSGKNKKKISDKPDLRKFSAVYGSKIRTPKKDVNIV